MVSFKSENGTEYYDRLYLEFKHWIDPRLRAVLLELDDWSQRILGKRVLITSLNRTKEENEKVGGSVYSAHLVGRAVDIRSRLFEEAELEQIKKHLMDAWGFSFLYVICHGKGSNKHIHINIRHAHQIKNYARVA